jgi:hypothetical protein
MNEALLRRIREARELKASLSAGEPGKVLVEEEYDDDILPFELYRNTRQNIERIADQINKSFHFEIYDGTAVLMRRLIEMLLILAFKQIGEEECIRGSDGNYLPLSDIVNCAVQNRHVDLSRNAKSYLGIFKETGDLSAHNPFHNCRKKDLELVRHKFRSLVEELLYKGGILV